jgi:valyl-tRNA synthetase
VERAKKAQSDDFPNGIPACGTDALRFGLLAYTAQGRDVNLDILRIVGYRQFCNKIWNAFRFAVTYLQDNFIPIFGMSRQILHSLFVAPRDMFILSRLNATTIEVNRALETYQFANGTTALHSFLLYDFCDVYLELLKPVFNLTETNDQYYREKQRVAQATLYTVLEQYLRLLHPFMPYITEELWQRLPAREQLTEDPSIMLSSYPRDIEEWTNEAAEKAMELVKDTIHAARSLRKQYNLPNHVKADFYFKTDASNFNTILSDQADDFCTLAKGNFLQPLPVEYQENIPSGFCIKLINDQVSLYVNLTGLLDVEAEIARLLKEVDR